MTTFAMSEPGTSNIGSNRSCSWREREGGGRDGGRDGEGEGEGVAGTCMIGRD